MFTPSSWGDRRRMRIGVLGGSFNPAHGGHVHISREAYRRLGLDQVWWLVSPQNPLKPKSGMAPLNERMSQAKALPLPPWLQVVSLEQDFGTVRTWQTLRLLKKRFPKARFVWLMGADNLVQMPLWSRWSKIFQSVHVAVFDRSPYSHHVLNGKASRRFARLRLSATHGKAMWAKGSSRWVYFAQRRHAASSTHIRLRGTMTSVSSTD